MDPAEDRILSAAEREAIAPVLAEATAAAPEKGAVVQAAAEAEAIRNSREHFTGIFKTPHASPTA